MTDEHPHTSEVEVDVFTHSKNGEPGAWTDSEVSSLLVAWQDVMERASSSKIDVAKRIEKRLARLKNFRTFDRREIREQLNTLRKEYGAYKTLMQLKIKTVRPEYVDYLERIIDEIPKSRQRLLSNGGASEDSDASRKLYAPYGRDSEGSRNGPRTPREVDPNTNEEVSSQRRVRFQRRVNLQRLIRLMIDQQQKMLEQMEKLFASMEVSHNKMAGIVETVVSPKMESLKLSEDAEQPELISLHSTTAE